MGDSYCLVSIIGSNMIPAGGRDYSEYLPSLIQSKLIAAKKISPRPPLPAQLVHHPDRGQRGQPGICEFRAGVGQQLPAAADAVSPSWR